MTIDEIIEELEESKGYPASDPASDEALDGAIDIMRKYQKIQTRLDRLEHSMECLLESDPRTFTDRECENGWLFDKIIEWRKVINEVLEDDNSTVDNSSM